MARGVVNPCLSKRVVLHNTKWFSLFFQSGNVVPQGKPEDKYLNEWICRERTSRNSEDPVHPDASTLCCVVQSFCRNRNLFGLDEAP